jgi:SAM-dependent methyltransferase
MATDDQALAIEDRYYDFLAGAAKAAALSSALDVGLERIFAQRGPMVAGDIAAMLGLNPHRTRKWLEVLVKVGLVQRGEDGRFAPSPLLATIAQPEGPASYFYREFLRYWRVATAYDLGAILRGAPVPYAVRYPPTESADTALLHDWMRSGALITLRAIQRVFDYQGVGRVLDVGGGDATMACELARQFPSLKITVFNVPQAADLARKNIQALGLGGQVEVVVGDFRVDHLPEGFDLVVYSRVLADWPPELCRELIAKAWRSVKAPGRILISEPFSDENPHLAVAWEHSYLPYDDFGAGCYKPTTAYKEMLTAAGFSDVQVYPRSSSIHGVMVAHKHV